MWNYYSKGNKYEGFNIGFFIPVLKTEIESYLAKYEAASYIYPVIYKKSTQKKLIEKLLLKLKDLYLEACESEIRCIISNQLLDWNLLFKHECFQHEEEVRIVIDVAKREKRIPIFYRFNAGYLVPYIEIKFDKECVSSIMFGPLQMQENQRLHQVRIMDELLTSKDYCAIIEYSTIPVRF